MQIPKRLKTIGDLVHDDASIADIGADHGLLEHYICANHSNCKIIAIENKKGPYSILKESVSSLNNVEVVLSDGLDSVDKNVDTLVLAGMGGENICKILLKHPDKVRIAKYVIVDSHSDLPKVRKLLIELGFDIELEKIIYEFGVYYVIISFKRNEKQNIYSENDITFGFKINEDPLFEMYKEFLLNKYANILSDIESSGLKNEKYKQILDDMERLKKYE